jgi:ABC-type lipoprotein export system ATPase subunit
MVTHDLEAGAIAGRQMRLEHGKLIERHHSERAVVV